MYRIIKSFWIFADERRSATRPNKMPPPIVREDVEGSAAGEETVTSSVAVPALARQQALGPLFSRVVNDEDLAVLSSILEQMDDLNDVARLRQTCRVLRDEIDACMKMKRTVVGERKVSLDMDKDIPWQLIDRKSVV